MKLFRLFIASPLPPGAWENVSSPLPALSEVEGMGEFRWGC